MACYCPGGGLMAYSDRGVSYTSEQDQRLLSTHGITCRKGNGWEAAEAVVPWQGRRPKHARACSMNLKCFLTESCGTQHGVPRHPAHRSRITQAKRPQNVGKSNFQVR